MCSHNARYCKYNDEQGRTASIDHGYSFFLNKFIYFIYLFLVALGLRCCEWAFSSCGEWGLLFVVVHGLLTAVASLVAEHGF